MRNPSTRHLVLIILAAALALLFALPMHLRPENFPADDAYFYLQVARNIAHGQGPTFHGVTPTNGFHPLWMLGCVASFLAAAGHSTVAVHLVFILQQALALGILALAWRILGRLDVRNRLVALPPLAIFFLTGLYGSEAHINGFCAALVLLAALQPWTPRPAVHAATVGALAGLAFLARLDNIFFVAALSPLFLALQARRRQGPLVAPASLRSALALGLAFLAIVIPYLLYNRLTFGHLMPISGAIKSTFPHASWKLDGLGALGKLSLLGALLSSAATLLFARAPERRFVFLSLGAGVIGHALYIILFTDDVTHWSWYYVLGVLNLSLALAAFADWFESILPRPALRAYAILLHAGLALLLLLGVGRAWIRYDNPDAIYGKNAFIIHAKRAERRWQAQLADWLRLNLPPNTRIIAYDWPGTFAFLSGQPILPVDGLINDFRYNDDILKLGIARYLEEHGVRYWLGPEVAALDVRPGWYVIRRQGALQSVEIFSPLYKKSAGTFTVRDADLVVRLRDVIAHPDTPPLALWRLQR